MSQQQKPGVGFWATVAAVTLFVLYPLSFGPACWIVSNMDKPPDGLIATVYRPIVWVPARYPQSMAGSLIVRYANWKARGQIFIFIDNDCTAMVWSLWVQTY